MVNIFDQNIPVTECILLIILVLCLLIQIFYYLYFYSRIAFYKPPGKNPRKGPVSIVICARDEADNLRKHLPSILEQDYPNYEVIVVNDCSEDESEKVLDELKAKYNHLKVSAIKKDEKFKHGKKFALLIGIKAAKNEWMLFTDADCYPESNQWLNIMQKNFKKNISIVIGYGGYKRENKLIDQFIRFDTTHIAMQYFGFALAGIPYMGVGRNLAYRKSLFFNNRGFASHMHLRSGDDDLFVNENATSENTIVEFNKESHIRSIPKKTFSEWIKQKQRHLTTSELYKTKHKFLLFLEPFTRVVFHSLTILFIIKFLYPVIIFSSLFLRTIVQLTFFKLTMSRLNEKKLLLSSFLLDILAPVYDFLFLFMGKFFSSDQNK